MVIGGFRIFDSSGARCSWTFETNPTHPRWRVFPGDRARPDASAASRMLLSGPVSGGGFWRSPFPGDLTRPHEIGSSFAVQPVPSRGGSRAGAFKPIRDREDSSLWVGLNPQGAGMLGRRDSRSWIGRTGHPSATNLVGRRIEHHETASPRVPPRSSHPHHPLDLPRGFARSEGRSSQQTGYVHEGGRAAHAPEPAGTGSRPEDG